LRGIAVAADDAVHDDRNYSINFGRGQLIVKYAQCKTWNFFVGEYTRVRFAP